MQLPTQRVWLPGVYALLHLPTEERSQRAWFLDPLRSVGMDFNGLDLRWGGGSGIGYAL